MRQRKKPVHTTPRVLTNPYKPVKGHSFDAYFNRSDIGSGWRAFLVLTVGRKFVTIFYAPQLMQVKLPLKEWANLTRIRPIFTDPTLSCIRIADRAAQYQRHNMQYHMGAVAQAAAILGCNK